MFYEKLYQVGWEDVAFLAGSSSKMGSNGIFEHTDHLWVSYNREGFLDQVLRALKKDYNIISPFVLFTGQLLQCWR